MRYGWLWENGSNNVPNRNDMSHCLKKLSADCICEISFSLQRYVKIILQIRTRSTCSIITLEYSEKEPALQCRRQDCVPDSSSLKPGSGATDGVLDKGVSGQPDYMHRPDYRSVKIQDSRLRLVSGWDSPLRGRQAWRSGYYVSFLVTDSM